MNRIVLIPAKILTAASAAAGNVAPPPLKYYKSASYNNLPQGGLRHVPTLMRGTERAFLRRYTNV